MSAPDLKPMSVPFASIHHAVRQLRATHAFTTMAVLTLALGIGGTAAIFTLIDVVMFRSLPVSEPARLYRVGDGDTAPPRAATAAGGCSHFRCTSD